MDVLVVSLATERYAVPVLGVREIVRAVALARVPGVPAVVEGIVNVRGRLVPVFDARKRFGYPARPMALTDFLVLVAAGARDVALHVDHVVGVESVPDDRIVAAAGVVRRSAFIAGLAALPDGTLLIHDPAAFLAESESEALDAALAEGTAA